MGELNDFIFKAKATLRTVEASAGASILDALSRDILDRVGDAQVKGETLIVGDIIENEVFGSPATAHGRLKRLGKQGWLKIVDDPQDGRRKILKLSDKAQRMYNKMSLALSKVNGAARARA